MPRSINKLLDGVKGESGFSLLSRSRMGTLKREKRTASQFSDASKARGYRKPKIRPRAGGCPWAEFPPSNFWREAPAHGHAQLRATCHNATECMSSTTIIISPTLRLTTSLLSP